VRARAHTHTHTRYSDLCYSNSFTLQFDIKQQIHGENSVNFSSFSDLPVFLQHTLLISHVMLPLKVTLLLNSDLQVTDLYKSNHTIHTFCLSLDIPYLVRYEVFMSMMIFWVLALYRLVDRCQRLREIYFLHLRSSRDEYLNASLHRSVSSSIM
jgi:hypothetical protein